MHARTFAQVFVHGSSACYRIIGQHILVRVTRQEPQLFMLRAAQASFALALRFTDALKGV
jgi:hypothetical protein